MNALKQHSQLEETFVYYYELLAPDAPQFTREYRFDKTRKWRADFCWEASKLILEIEGGIQSGGRHVRPYGYTNDCEKYNRATVLGYRILRFTGEMLTNDPQTCVQIVLEALAHGKD